MSRVLLFQHPALPSWQGYPARKVPQNGSWLCILLGVVYPEPEIISQMLRPMTWETDELVLDDGGPCFGQRLQLILPYFAALVPNSLEFNMFASNVFNTRGAT